MPIPTQTIDSQDTLNHSLDDLLERYLNLLDQFQRQRQDLHGHLSSGYLSLAHANFSNPNRIRYGQDYYDDRMQATSHVSIDQFKEERESFSASPHVAFKFSQSPTARDDQEQNAKEASNTNIDESAIPSNKKDKSSTVLGDPLHWYGLFVPPALITSQNHFKSVVMDDIPALATLSKEIRELEIEVRRTRKKLKKSKANS